MCSRSWESSSTSPATRSCVSRGITTRVLITHGVSQAWIDDAPPGLLLTPDITAERRIDVIVSLLESEGELDGRKVAVLAARGQRGAHRVHGRTGARRGRCRARLRRRSRHLGHGHRRRAGAARQLHREVEDRRGGHGHHPRRDDVGQAVRREDQSGDARRAARRPTPPTFLGQGRDLVRAGTTPNPYDGMITAEGETGVEHSRGEEAARCREIYKKAFGVDPPGPNEVVAAPNGKRNDIQGAVSDACTEVTMFADIAAAAGDTLNADTWTEAVHGMGEMRIASTEVRVARRGEVRRRRHVPPGGIRPDDPRARRLARSHSGPQRRRSRSCRPRGVIEEGGF